MRERDTERQVDKVGEPCDSQGSPNLRLVLHCSIMTSSHRFYCSLYFIILTNATRNIRQLRSRNEEAATADTAPSVLFTSLIFQFQNAASKEVYMLKGNPRAPSSLE